MDLMKIDSALHIWPLSVCGDVQGAASYAGLLHYGYTSGLKPMTNPKACWAMALLHLKTPLTSAASAQQYHIAQNMSGELTGRDMINIGRDLGKGL